MFAPDGEILTLMLMSLVHGGHSASTSITILSNTTNYNLANDLTNNYGWNGFDATAVTVNSGVEVSATATTVVE